MIICYKILTTIIILFGVVIIVSMFLDLNIGRIVEKGFELLMVVLVAILAIEAIGFIWTLS